LGIGCNGGIGHIGDSAFGLVGIDIGLLLDLHGITVQVMRYAADPARDIYGEPLDAVASTSAKVLLARQEMKEDATMAGGKRNEMLTLVGLPGTLLENDMVAYGGHKFDVRNVGKTTAQSVVVAEVYVAVREVDV
jgi:hypothetical protein